MAYSTMLSVALNLRASNDRIINWMALRSSSPVHFEVLSKHLPSRPY